MHQIIKSLLLLVTVASCSSTLTHPHLIASTTAVPICQTGRIIKIDSISQIEDSNSQPDQTLYFFDIDDTLFHSPYMLGSKTWRKHISTVTKEDQAVDWRALLSLFIARHHPMETIEPSTGQLVQDLQMKGYGVFALTARERKLWYNIPFDADTLTINQLNSVGIDFENAFLETAYPYIANAPEYYKGVLFADTEEKGEYVLKLFKNASHLPEKVVFIDDKQNQVESVAAALNELGISYECYWYTATDKIVHQFDPLIANVQLFHFWMHGGKHALSNEEAALIATQNPDKEAHHYLQTVLEQAKEQLLLPLER